MLVLMQVLEISTPSEMELLILLLVTIRGHDPPMLPVI